MECIFDCLCHYCFRRLLIDSKEYEKRKDNGINDLLSVAVLSRWTNRVKINVCIFSFLCYSVLQPIIALFLSKTLSFGLIYDVSRPIEAMLLMLVYNLNCLDLNHQFHYFCELKISSVLVFQHTKSEQPQNSNNQESVLINETFPCRKTAQ